MKQEGQNQVTFHLGHWQVGVHRVILSSLG